MDRRKLQWNFHAVELQIALCLRTGPDSRGTISRSVCQEGGKIQNSKWRLATKWILLIAAINVLGVSLRSYALSDMIIVVVNGMEHFLVVEALNGGVIFYVEERCHKPGSGREHCDWYTQHVDERLQGYGKEQWGEVGLGWASGRLEVTIGHSVWPYGLGGPQLWVSYWWFALPLMLGAWAVHQKRLWRRQRRRNKLRAAG